MYSEINFRALIISTSYGIFILNEVQ
jgi:hypothetical protein